MADLRPGPRGERAQLIIIAGFVIAVSLVGLALVINAAIFTENLATRSETSGAVDALSYRSATERGLGAVLAFENDQHAGNPGTVDSEMQTAIEEYSELSTRQQATGERVVDVRYSSSEFGHRIFQDGPRVFRSGDSDSGGTTWSNSRRNWTLATSVENVRQFRIGVSNQDNLTEFRSDRREFRVLVNKSSWTGTQGWWFNVTRDNADQAVVTVSDNSNEVSTCRETVGTDDDFWVNVTAGTLDGVECEPLQFAEGVSGSYDIYYLNSSNAEGNYSLLVDGSQTGNYDPGGEDPQTEQRLYVVEADLVYRTTQLNYTTTVRIAPGEPDE